MGDETDDEGGGLKKAKTVQPFRTTKTRRRPNNVMDQQTGLVQPQSALGLKVAHPMQLNISNLLLS